MVPRADPGVRLAFPDLGEEELAEVRAVLASGALTMGPKVEELEGLVAAACGVERPALAQDGADESGVAVAGGREFQKRSLSVTPTPIVVWFQS